jgi:hypothetical protein
MPAVPGAGLVVVEAQFVFGRLEAVLDGPELSFDVDQHRKRGAGGAPSGEESQVALSDIAADQKIPYPKTGQVLIVFGRFEIGQFQIGPVKQPLALGAGPCRYSLVIVAALPVIGGWAPQELNWLLAGTPST